MVRSVRRPEADDLEQTYQATKADGVTFLGINTRDQRDAAKAFVRGRSTYPSVFDPAGRLALGFKVPPTAIPSTIIIDRQGRIAAVAPARVLRSELEPIVAAAGRGAAMKIAATPAKIAAIPSQGAAGRSCRSSWWQNGVDHDLQVMIRAGAAGPWAMGRRRVGG